MDPLVFVFEFHFSTAVAILIILNVSFSYWALRFYYNRDTPHREPLRTFIAAMSLGMFVFLIIFSVSLFFAYFSLSNLQDSLWIINLQQSKFIVIFLIPIVEELLKAGAYLYMDRKKDIRSPLDALTIGAMIGSGFALLENIMYGISALLTNGFSAALSLTGVRATALIVGHPLYTGLFSVAIAYKKAGIKQHRLPRILSAIFLHITWNLLVLLQFVIHMPFPIYASVGISVIVVLSYSLLLFTELSYAKSIEQKLVELGIDPHSHFLLQT